MQLLCSHCGTTVQASEDQAGSDILCPNCQGNVHVPDFAEDLTIEAGDFDDDDGFANQAKQAMEEKIRIICGSCGRGLKTPLKMAGHKVNCPGCKKRIRIPYPSEMDEQNGQAPVSEVESNDQAASDQAQPVQQSNPSPPSEPEAPPERAEQTDPADTDVFETTVVAFTPEDESPDDVAPASPPSAEASIEALAQASAKQDTGEWPVVTQPASRSRAPVGQKRSIWPLAAVAGVAVLAAGLVVVLWPVIFGGPDDGDSTTAVVTVDTPPASTQSNPTPAQPSTQLAQPRPPAQPTQKPTPTPAPKAPRAYLEFNYASMKLFAGQGRHPAPPESIYLQIEGVLTSSFAGELALYGGDVTLGIGKRTFNPIGRAGRFGPVMPADRGRIAVAPKQPVKLHLLFELPQAVLTDSPRVTMAVKGFGEFIVGRLMNPVDDVFQTGTYKELPPRNLKPLLRDPVMRAMQSTESLSMVVARDGKDLKLTIPSAGVTGRLKPLKPGLYQAQLAAGKDALTCKLRAYDRSRNVVVYLDDSPFHQIVFAKAGMRQNPNIKLAPDAGQPVPPPEDPTRTERPGPSVRTRRPGRTIFQ